MAAAELKTHVASRDFPVHTARPGRVKNDRVGQVSWLADHRLCASPSQTGVQWRLTRRLTAYSCGDSRGLRYPVPY